MKKAVESILVFLVVVGLSVASFQLYEILIASGSQKFVALKPFETLTPFIYLFAASVTTVCVLAYLVRKERIKDRFKQYGIFAIVPFVSVLALAMSIRFLEPDSNGMILLSRIPNWIIPLCFGIYLAVAVKLKPRQNKTTSLTAEAAPHP